MGIPNRWYVEARILSTGERADDEEANIEGHLIMDSNAPFLLTDAPLGAAGNTKHPIPSGIIDAGLYYFDLFDAETVGEQFALISLNTVNLGINVSARPSTQSSVDVVSFNQSSLSVAAASAAFRTQRRYTVRGTVLDGSVEPNIAPDSPTDSEFWATADAGPDFVPRLDNFYRSPLPRMLGWYSMQDDLASLDRVHLASFHAEITGYEYRLVTQPSTADTHMGKFTVRQMLSGNLVPFAGDKFLVS